MKLTKLLEGMGGPRVDSRGTPYWEEPDYDDSPEDPGFEGTATVDWEHYDPETGNVIPYQIQIQYDGSETLDGTNPDLRSLGNVQLIGGEVNGEHYDAATLIKLFGADEFAQEDLKFAVREYIEDLNKGIKQLHRSIVLRQSST